MHKSNSFFSEFSKDASFNVIVMGSQASGKTALITKYLAYLEKTYTDSIKLKKNEHIQVVAVRPTGNNTSLRIVEHNTLNGPNLSLTSQGNAIIFVFDLSAMNSFFDMLPSLCELRKQLPEVPIVLAGSKIDQSSLSIADMSTIREFAANNKMTLMETSVQEDINVHELFQFAIKEASKPKASYQAIDVSRFNGRRRHETDSSEPKKSCCFVM